jgi:hypothetical protein
VDAVGSLDGNLPVCQVTPDANLVFENGISTDASTNATIYAQTDTYADGGRNCYWSNDDNIANLSPTLPNSREIRLDTEEQYAACSAQIAARCEDLGL